MSFITKARTIRSKTQEPENEKAAIGLNNHAIPRIITSMKDFLSAGSHPVLCQSRALLLALPLVFGACSKNPEVTTAPPQVEVDPRISAELEDARRALEDTRTALDQQATEIEDKSEALNRRIEEMELAARDKENAELQAKLAELKADNAAMQAKADAARDQSMAMAEKLAESRNMQPGPQPDPARDLADVSVFYRDLAPHGRWFDVDGHGYCFQPTLARQSGWRPYLDGQWVWSDKGWAWVSNEPIGWAVYHYGRWVQVAGYGWLWVPGVEWAPAWVSWRRGDEYIGWAPLPPEPAAMPSIIYDDADVYYDIGPSYYTFIETTYFFAPTYIHHCRPIIDNRTIIYNTRNVTRIICSTDRDRRPIHFHRGGPDRMEIERVCRRPAPRGKFDYVDRPREFGPRKQESGVMAIPVVDLRAKDKEKHRPVDKPDRVEKILKPVRDNGYAGMPAGDADRIREKIKDQAKPAKPTRPPHAGRPGMAEGRPVQPGNVERPKPVVPGERPDRPVRPGAQPRPGEVVGGSPEVPVVPGKPEIPGNVERPKPVVPGERPDRPVSPGAQPRPGDVVGGSPEVPVVPGKPEVPGNVERPKPVVPGERPDRPDRPGAQPGQIVPGSGVNDEARKQQAEEMQRRAEEAKRGQMDEARKQQAEEMQRRAEEVKRGQMDEARKQQAEEMQRRAEEVKRGQMDEARKQQAEEMQRRAEEAKRGQMEETRKQQAEEMQQRQQQQEQAKREQMEQARRQQQEEMQQRQQQQEQARRQQMEEAKRGQQEQARRQQQEEMQQRQQQQEEEKHRKRQN